MEKANTNITGYSYHHPKDVLGRGSFGIVYKCFHQKTNSHFAIKEIPLQDHDDKELNIEIEVLKAKKHPNVVTVVDSIVHKTENETRFLYIVMELCDGNLNTFLRDNIEDGNRFADMNQYCKINMMHQVAQALKYLQSRKPYVVHRDIKLENILVKMKDSTIVLLLADFGQATFLEEKKGEDMSTKTGTPIFNAPEKFIDSGHYSASSDIFSLGLVYSVIWKFSADHRHRLPMPIGGQGEVAEFGLELLNTNRNNTPPPILVEHQDKDDIISTAVVRVIRSMTKLDSSERMCCVCVAKRLSELQNLLEEKLEKFEVHQDAMDMSECTCKRKQKLKAYSTHGIHINVLPESLQFLQQDSKFFIDVGQRDLKDEHGLSFNYDESLDEEPILQTKHAENTADYTDFLITDELKKTTVNEMTTLLWRQVNACSITMEPLVFYPVKSINKTIWVVYLGVIKVYDMKVQEVRSIPFGHDIGKVHDFDIMSNGELVLGTASGLYHLSETGETLNRIHEGRYSTVHVYSERVFAAERESNTLQVYQMQDTWEKLDPVNMPCKSKEGTITISICNDRITICCSEDNTLYVLSMTGVPLQAYGQYGDEESGNFHQPFICCEDETGLLVADRQNKRLVVRNVDGEWNEVERVPTARDNSWTLRDQPARAFLIDGHLYILAWKEERAEYYLALHLPS